MQLLVLGAVVGGVTYAMRGADTWQIVASDESTSTGEIRELALPDGTRVVLGSTSAIDVRFDQRECLIILRAGEIMVTTAPDPVPVHRPLRVQGRAGTAAYRHWGTRFTVRQAGDSSRVAVFEGAVEIRPAHAADAAVRIDAGHGATFSSDRVRAPEPVQENAAAWTRGVLVADGLRVDEFLAELASYRPACCAVTRPSPT